VVIDPYNVTSAGWRTSSLPSSVKVSASAAAISHIAIIAFRIRRAARLWKTLPLKPARISSYTEKVNFLRILIPAALLLVSAGCQKNVQTSDAVLKGVKQHLANNKGLNVDSMDIQVTAVAFRDTEADATVSFKPKGGDPASGMEMKYTLERKGNDWVVKQTPKAGGHGAMMPGGMGSGMGGGMGAGQGMQMPPNHPPAGAAPDPKK
jgi:hypothetical protein